jgi:GMP synthase-like glutamine amidotransferase
MKQYAVVQHTYSEFLGLIEQHLEKRDIGFNYFRPFVGQDLPGSALQFDGLFLLAGRNPALDQATVPWFEHELNLISIFRRAARPVVGFGAGGLIVAAAFGAELLAEPRHTAGWTTANITEAGRGDPVAEALHGRRVLSLYEGDAKLPQGIEPILLADDGRWLGIRPDTGSYGLLFRPELKPGMIEDMIMEANRDLPDNIGELLAEARELWPDMQGLTDDFIVALVKSLNLMTERRKAPVFSLKVE